MIQTTMRILRERAGLTQEQLATTIDRTQPQVSMWEGRVEAMPDAIRNQIYGVLKAELKRQGQASRLLRPEDLDQPWDEVLEAWRLRTSSSETS